MTSEPPHDGELDQEVERALERVEQGEQIALRRFSTPQMRAFHLSWFAFFLAFFGWFGIAPLMAVVREDLDLSSSQVGNTIIASVAVTAFARQLVGWCCDRFGPRLSYSGLLILGAIPVIAIGLAENYESLLLLRLAIGVIGASFVITQYHVSLMFSADVVGTANATAAGWGNLGGGLAQMAVPLVLSALIWCGIEEALGWRLAMLLPGSALLVMGIAYYHWTQDTPFGNFGELRERQRARPAAPGSSVLRLAAADYRVWTLFLAYAACFGVELTINNIAALYFHDRFGLSVGVAGVVAGLFGLMNLFARPLGGLIGDRAGIRSGLRGRALFLAGVLLLEALMLIVFSRMGALPLAIASMIVCSLFVQMSEGATFSIVPFVNRRALGSVAGLVGAGGNAGAVGFGFLLRGESRAVEDALLVIALFVLCAAVLVLVVRFDRSRAATPTRE